jgi:hypothetical protein
MMPKYNLKVVKTFDYKRPEIEKGYTDQTLYVNISDADISDLKLKRATPIRHCM